MFATVVAVTRCCLVFGDGEVAFKKTMALGIKTKQGNAMRWRLFRVQKNVFVVGRISVWVESIDHEVWSILTLVDVCVWYGSVGRFGRKENG